MVSPGASPPVVLVAEDDPAIRDVLSMVLGDAGYHVVTAVDGLDALESVRRELPAVILADATMPRLDGAGFCRAYRASGGTAPVILISAGDPDVITATVNACGAAAYIPKPFEIDAVLATVARTLDGRSKATA